MRLWLTFALFSVVSYAGCGSSGSIVKTDSKADATAVSTSENSETTSSDSTPNASSSDEVLQDPRTSPPSDEVQIIGFDDLNLGMPEDARFRPMMLQYNDGRAKELLGAVVNIAGHMNPPDQLRGLKEFVLLKNKDCKFGPGGQADHLARVYMKEGTTVDYTDEVIYVEGKITLEPFPDDSPMTWSIYDIEATKVSTRPPRRNR